MRESGRWKGEKVIWKGKGRRENNLNLMSERGKEGREEDLNGELLRKGKERQQFNFEG